MRQVLDLAAVGALLSLASLAAAQELTVQRLAALPSPDRNRACGAGLVAR